MTASTARARVRAAATSLAVAASVAWGPGCIASSEEVRPPDDALYFPSGVALAPDGRHLGVASANSDLRFDSGTLLLVDLNEVRGLLDGWLASGDVPEGRACEVDRTMSHTLVCEGAEVIRPDSSVRIGNFATSLGFQQLSSGVLRAFITVRGDPSITWVDADPDSGRMDCGGDEPHHRCDDAHRLGRVRGDEEVGRLPSEPFGLFVDGESEYAMVSHLTSGSVSLVDAPITGEPPVIADTILGLFQANADGVQGAVGVASRRPGDPAGRVYVTSRSEATVRSLSVVRGSGLPELAIGRQIDLRDLGRPGDDGRGIAFNADGTRAYVVNRSPPTLQMIDTRIDEFGQPADRPIGSVGVCREGSNAVVADTGRGERVYVACFRDHEVWVVNPANRSVDAIIPVGRGPHGLAVSEDDALLFVTGFVDHTLSVVDIEEGSDTENRTVLRLSGWSDAP